MGVTSLPELVDTFTPEDRQRLSPRTIQRWLKGQKISAGSETLLEPVLSEVLAKLLLTMIGVTGPREEARPYLSRMEAWAAAERAAFLEHPWSDFRTHPANAGLSEKEAGKATFPQIIKVNLCWLASFDAQWSTVGADGKPVDWPSLFQNLFPRPEPETSRIRLPLWWWLYYLKEFFGLAEKGFSSAEFAEQLLEVDSHQPDRWSRASSYRELPKWDGLTRLGARLFQALKASGRNTDHRVPLMLMAVAARGLHKICIASKRAGYDAGLLGGLMPWYGDTVIAWRQVYLRHLQGLPQAGPSPLLAMIPNSGS